MEIFLNDIDIPIGTSVELLLNQFGVIDKQQMNETMVQKRMTMIHNDSSTTSGIV